MKAPIAITALWFVLGPSLLSAQCKVEEIQSIDTPDGRSSEFFGYAVAADAGRMLVGAPLDGQFAGLGGSCSAFEIGRDGRWAHTQTFVPSTAVFGDGWGASLALDGRKAALGSLGAEAVAIFRQARGTWTEEQLLFDDPGRSSAFGRAVALEGDWCLIGAPKRGNQGSAYFFHFDGSNWNLDSEFQGIADGDEFGASVVLEGTRAAVGAPGVAGGTGEVRIFELLAGVWTYQRTLRGSSSGSGDRFGASLATSQDVLVVGSPALPRSGTGACTVFRHNGKRYVEEQILTSSDGGALDGFSDSGLAVFGGRIAVGAPGHAEGAASSGAAYLFVHDGSGWLQEREFVAASPAPGDGLGRGLALTEDQVLLGAPFARSWLGVFDSSPLSLHIDPLRVSSGDTVDLDCYCGRSGAPLCLALTAVDGVPTFQCLFVDRFSVADAHWRLRTTVPTGLSGFEAEFSVLGFATLGELELTRPVAVTFQ